MFNLFDDQERFDINSFTGQVNGGQGMFGGQPGWQQELENALSPQVMGGPGQPSIPTGIPRADIFGARTEMMPGNNNPQLPQPYGMQMPGKPIEVDEIEMKKQSADLFSPGNPGGNKAARIGNAVGGLANIFTSMYGINLR